jgi:hypothetical protein
VVVGGDRFFDDGFGGGAVLPVAGLGRLAGLEGLVDAEEVLDLVEQEPGDVAQLRVRRPARVGRGDAQDLVVLTVLVAQAQDTRSRWGTASP